MKSRPTEKELLDHVATAEVIAKWKDLGMKLLSSAEVEIIEQDNPKNVKRCCMAMFTKWLQTNIHASWKQLIAELRSPGVYLPVLANALEEKFSGLSLYVT